MHVLYNQIHCVVWNCVPHTCYLGVPLDCLTELLMWPGTMDKLKISLTVEGMTNFVGKNKFEDG